MAHRKTHVGLAALITVTVLGGSVAHASPARAQPVPPGDAGLVAELEAATGGTAEIAYHSETGKVRYIGMANDQPVAAAAASSAPAEDLARGFLARYGSLFGVTDQASELRATDSQERAGGGKTVRFQQVSQGVPVLAGELVVNMDSAGNVVAASGEVLPSPKVNVTPTVAAQTARQTAIDLVAKHYQVDTALLSATTPELWIHNPALIGGPGLPFTSLVWRVEVTSAGAEPVRELVLVHAQLGAIVLNFNQIAEAKNRHVCDQNNVPGPYTCTPATAERSEGDPPTGIGDVDDAYDLSGVVYDFFHNRYGRDSLNNKGMALISTVRHCDPMFPCPYENAFWDGAQMVYGDGYASADDVVGHELAHGVTDFTSHLFYYYQSGAINESLSDVFGELIDQSSTLSGPDAPADRWLMGEDLPIGAIRDMQSPPAFGDPDRVGSPNYHTAPSDNGGVHINSGVNNKAAYLLVDGGSFNGRTVTRLGNSLADASAKVGRLYYEAENNLLTSGSDYQDLYSYLHQACRQLMGVRPPGASTAFSAANCADVLDAVSATQMNLVPSGAPNRKAPICPARRVPVELFWDDLENPATGNWARTKTTPSSTGWFYPQNPNAYGFDGTYAESGRYNFWAVNDDVPMDARISRTGNVTVPRNRTTYLYFDHAYDFETGTTGTPFDGGVVEYSVTNGRTWVATNALPTDNGYNANIASGFGNPLAGRRAFTRDSNGYQSTRINISSLAGRNVRFRFRVGADVGGGLWFGWFVDDISVYYCAAPPANPVAPNKLRNRGFEYDWDRNTFVDSWTSNDRFMRSAVTRHGGRFSARLQDPANVGSFAVFQRVPVAPRSVNRFTGWLRIPPTGDPFTFRAQLIWRTAGGAAIGSPVTLHSRSNPTGGAWIQMARGRLAAPGTARFADIRLVAGSLAAPAYVDDFYFGP
jgi:Zn-dependent metalloprotease